MGEGSQHAVQVSGCPFNIKVFILSSPALRGQDCTLMELLEISIDEFVMCLRLRVFLVVYAKMPFRVFGEAMLLDDLILVLRGWAMLTPRISIIEHNFLCVDQFLGVIECWSI
jgi:hypothetical protein